METFFNAAVISFIIIGLDLQVTYKGEEVFRLCWGIQWIIKGVLPKYKD
ncbi:hypothetical protein CPAST_c40490 [Clostridium pasteurianum DSM 525 = ATCC 6013]|uniref:Uncharacterized protein n=1 Tax=Clostridium pasteurianum DSM 525 = ATCC 6013 TaxID=1262449 RepID=A0A0H3JB15_CLOPA|nr:hypothetical protein [Clostridium pasteurianum]AJA50078.1 hypothetical protein CPAST_c40490 [Clostridium pasteurianum DSM 525 = ATCC 6013]AJA54066.1 hypothetical protein CLPA_c40490 [Clostridium pasteurianum DSM 525 = ATCC 6013]KRU13909.1 hypothetical protein CP6013_03165 [Clostridium pasteurianum DSM 525 = ATCC 6013]